MKVNFRLKSLHIIIWLVFLSGFSGCRNRETHTDSDNTKEVRIIDIDPEKAVGQRLVDIIDEVKFKELKLPMGIFFTGIEKVVFKNNHIYILDISSNGNKSVVFCFDLEGNLLFMLDKQGKGPGEYEYVYNISLTNKLLALSVPGGKIMFYDNSNGSYLKTEKMPETLSTQIFEMMDDHTLVSASGRYKRNTSHKQLKVYDLNKKKIIHEAVSYDSPALKLGQSYRYLYHYGDTLSSLPMYDQMIYRIIKRNDNYKVVSVYKLDFGKYWMDEKILNNSYNNREQFFGAMDKYIHTVDVFETDDILYLYYRYKSEDFAFIYSKTKNITLNISSFTHNEIGWKKNPLTTWNDYLVTIVTPLEMEIGNFQPGEKYKKFFIATGEKASPVMVLLKLRI